jgi:mitochondrial fission protein ELM1
MENQCLGLAEAVGLPIEVKRARLRWPFSVFAPQFWGNPLRQTTSQSTPLRPPWPKLLIACGRQSIPLAIAIHRRSEGKTILVQTQNPRVDLALFDMVVPPEHDGVSGGNVFPIVGAPHRVTPKRLSKAKERWADPLARVPKPRVAVLIGGNSKAYTMDRQSAEGIARDLKRLAAQGAGLMVTASRRTPASYEALIRDALSGTSAYFWNGQGENPYFGLLAWADVILVTEDSVNMVTEAASTGKSVHILPLSGGSPKFERFHGEMAKRGITRPYLGKLEVWSYVPLRETERAAAEIRTRLGLETPPTDLA